MKAVILAAGEGTRLRPFTVARPKVMIPIGNRPILEYVIEALAANGIKDIVLVVGYMKERIMSFFGNGSNYGVDITYVIQDKQLGTAHAALMVRDHLDSDFILVAGDNIIDAKSVADLLTHKGKAAMLVTESEIPSKYGVVHIEDGYVREIIEKPQKRLGNIINTGMYRFSPHIFDFLQEGIKQGKYGFTHILQLFIDELDIEAVRTGGRWMDAIYPWDIIRLNEFALELKGQEITGTLENGAIIKGAVKIGAGTKIRAGTYIEGPVIIGEGCDIGPYTTIFPTTSIGNGVCIGPYTSIYNSMIMNNVSIGSHSHLCQAVIDDGCRISTGFTAPCSSSHVRVENEFHKVDRVGCMMGEFTVVGPRVVVSPGSIIGAGCKLSDGAKIGGNLENKSVVV